MFDTYCLLLVAYCFPNVVVAVGRWIPYFWLLLVTLDTLLLSTGTGIRIQKFCFSCGE